MRSTFSRQLGVTICVVLLGLCLVGTAFSSLLFRYLIGEKQNSLTMEASAVADLAAAVGSSGELETDWDFRMSVSFSTQATGIDLVICDETGTVIVCSGQDQNCNHLNKRVSEDFVSEVRQAGVYHTNGYLAGLYEDQRYITAMPILSADSGDCLGVVLVSEPFTETLELLRRLIQIFISSAIVAMLVAVFVSTFVARGFSRPMQKLAQAMRRFGHGDMTARVRLPDSSTEELLALGDAFNTMADAIAEADRSRSEFVANVSHELKTPMTTIAGYMDGILDGTIPPERHTYYMQIVSNEVRRLSRLVRSMLDVSRLQSQGIPEDQKTRFDICESVGMTLISFEQKINLKNIQVEVTFPDEPMYVLAVPDQITQVVYNLLDNAVKFCPQDGVLRATIWAEGAKAMVSIANSGPTIPPEELPHVFERFHKTDKSRSADRDGWGLGLYIVKTIIGCHGEDIRVASSDGMTEFVFTLPLTKRGEPHGTGV